MAKAQSFADKVNKKSRVHSNVCPECNSEFKRVQSVKPYQSQTQGSWKFNQKMVDVCKCNEKEVYSL